MSTRRRPAAATEPGGHPHRSVPSQGRLSKFVRFRLAARQRASILVPDDQTRTFAGVKVELDGYAGLAGLLAGYPVTSSAR